MFVLRPSFVRQRSFKPSGFPNKTRFLSDLRHVFRTSGFIDSRGQTTTKEGMLNFVDQSYYWTTLCLPDKLGLFRGPGRGHESV